MQTAKAGGTEAVVAKFERAIATKSRVVISRDSAEVYRLACGDNQLYTTYYKLIEAGFRVPTDSKWDAVRAIVDAKAFPYFGQHIRFGALSLDKEGLSHYGDCHMFLKVGMTHFRTTVFTENTAGFVRNDQLSIPRGHRATWKRRGRLAVAKLATKFTASSSDSDFSEILKKSGTSADNDSFIEAHVYGSISMRTVRKVTMSREARPAVNIRALREKLGKLDVPLVRV